LEDAAQPSARAGPDGRRARTGRAHRPAPERAGPGSLPVCPAARDDEPQHGRPPRAARDPEVAQADAAQPAQQLLAARERYVQLRLDLARREILALERTRA